MNCLLEVIAATWLNILDTFDNRRLQGDLVTVAKEQLREAINSMNTQMKKNENELSDISTQIKNKRDSIPKETLKKMLQRSRRIRICLRSDSNKVLLMEGQLETMENNEVNKTVLASLQSSAKAMQHMGLNKDLQRTDEVISELEAGMNFVHDINSTVGTSLSQMDIGPDEDSLEAELNLILGIETPNKATELTQSSQSTSTTQLIASEQSEQPTQSSSTDRVVACNAVEMV
jgi:hypothetical protein